MLKIELKRNCYKEWTHAKTRRSVWSTGTKPIEMWRRDRCLREQGFQDCFRMVKAKETDTALMMLEPLLE